MRNTARQLDDEWPSAVDRVPRSGWNGPGSEVDDLALEQHCRAGARVLWERVGDDFVARVLGLGSRTGADDFRPLVPLPSPVRLRHA
jgi:hypothetical protein